jgi:hypothetical protein
MIYLSDEQYEKEYIDNNNKMVNYINSLPSNIKILDLSYRDIYELPDDILERFTNLKYLYIERNLLLKLPRLPSTLKVLYCFSNFLKELPILPEGLKILYSCKNYLTKIPNIPSSLEELYIYGNMIEEQYDYLINIKKIIK